MRYFFFSILIVFAVFSFADAPKEKSLWDSFVGFFSPDEKPQGEGPLYKELSDLDAKIQREKLACARERRPQKKAFLKSHLEELGEKRDILLEKINAQEKTSAASSIAASSSLAVSVSSSSILTVMSSSSTTAAAPLPQSTPAVALAKQPQLAYVFRDTIYVHDTIYVERCLGDSLVAPAPAEKKP